MFKVVSHYYEDLGKMQSLRDKSNKVWTQHFIYTRQAIISLLAGLPDVTAVTERISKNQEDIGDLLRPYYPSASVDQFVTLLKQHISLAAQYIVATRDGLPTTDIETAWTANGNAILDWKASVNPWNWPRSKTEPVWTAHMTTTIAEITARAAKDWAGDIVAADAAYEVIGTIAKSFANGIIYQNIESFCKTTTEV